MDGAVAPPRVSCAECLAELTGTPRFCPECGARIATTAVGLGSRRSLYRVKEKVVYDDDLARRVAELDHP